MLGELRWAAHQSEIERSIDIVSGRLSLRPSMRDEFRQEAWLHLLHDDEAVLRRFRGGSGLATFLVAVLSNLWFSRIRAASRDRRRCAGRSEECLVAAPAEQRADDEVMRSESARTRHRYCQALQAALQTLPPQSRILIRRWFCGELSGEALAREYNTSPRRIYHARRIILKRLREDMEKSGVDGSDLVDALGADWSRCCIVRSSSRGVDTCRNRQATSHTP